MADRYNFTIHAKARVGRLIGMSFITAWFAAEQDAIDFATWLNTTILANYAKVSCSKVIYYPAKADWQIPSTHIITDVKTAKMLLKSSLDPTGLVKYNITIPGCKLTAPVEDIITKKLKDAETGLLELDNIVVDQMSYQNVIEGGPA